MHEVQDHGKAFCYSWLLLLIALVAWEALEGVVLPELELDMCEGARYANLWDSKDAKHVEENKVSWVLFDNALAAKIHSRPHLSLTMYEKYKGIVTFQVTMHNVQIQGCKDPSWMPLPYMVTDEEINRLITTWPPHWRLGFKSSGTMGTAGTSAAPKETTLVDTIKETGVRDIEGATRIDVPKDVTQGMEQESQQDMETKELDGQSAVSPRGTKQVTKPPTLCLAGGKVSFQSWRSIICWWWASSLDVTLLEPHSSARYQL